VFSYLLIKGEGWSRRLTGFLLSFLEMIHMTLSVPLKRIMWIW